MQQGNMFFLLWLCTERRSSAIGNVSVFNGESEFNPHVYWIKNAIRRLSTAHLCDIRSKLSAKQRVTGGAGGAGLPMSAVLVEHSRTLLIVHAKSNVRPEVLIYGVGFGDSDLQI